MRTHNRGRTQRETAPRSGAGRTPAERLLEISPDAMLFVGTDGRIRCANRQLSALFGYQPHELVGAPLSQLIPAPIELLTDSLLREGPGRTEVGRRRDGTPVTVALRARGLGGRRPTGALVSCRPAAGRDRTTIDEPPLDNELVASLSHDLRTPLNAIIGFAELMYNGRVGPLLPAHREYLGDILASGQRLQRLIDDLLSLARLDEDDGGAPLQRVALDRLTAEVRDLVRGLAISRQVRLEFHADPTVVLCNPVWLKRTLIKIALSALKLTPERGEVTLRLERAGTDQLTLAVGQEPATAHPGFPTQVVIDTAQCSEADLGQ